MNLSIGIVGLPNVGKSTLFNALLKKQVALEANYPFATIDPNVGIVEVPNERLAILASIVKTNKIVPAAVQFYDIAGLVRGASQGEGLGNQFLSHIRESSAIAQVVRLFEDSDIIHVEEKPDPVRDIQTIETELMLADLQTLSKQREPKGTSAPKEAFATYEVIKRVKDGLDKGIAVRNQKLSLDDLEHLHPLNLLTIKPTIFCFNCSLEQLDNPADTKKKIDEILTQTNNQGNDYILFNPLIETTLNDLIQAGYSTLSLISFLTAGEKEVRAWTIAKGTLAPQAAATIHTDFEKKFIKADICAYDDFVACKGWFGAREQGKVQIVGKDYEMKDNEVVEFKIGA